MSDGSARAAPSRQDRFVTDECHLLHPTRVNRIMERIPEIGAPGLHRRRGLFGIAAGGVAALSAGCSLPVRGTAVPIGRTAQASVLGVPNERFFPFYGTEPLEI